MQMTALLGAAMLLLLGSTLGAQTDLLGSIARQQTGRSMRATSGNRFDNNDSAKLAIGETITIAELEGPGEIEHIWMTPSSMDIRYPRALVLRAYWDGAQDPSIEVPLGDFFGVGNGMRAEINSLPVKASSHGRAYNCYWRMPFKQSARITLTNESDKARASCYYQIDWVKLPKVPKGLRYFHARYHQEYPPVLGEHYTVFEGEGSGHYVGTVLSSRNGIGHWFGEGDDLVYIDGETEPSIVGTGTEDYINEAWNMRVHSGPFCGCTVFEPRAPDARVSAYRWHIPDPIRFEKSIRMELERRGFLMDENGVVVAQSGSRPDFWSSVSFWYQDEPAKPWCEVPPYGDRVNPEVVVHLPEAVDRMAHSDGVALEVNDYNRATYTKPWFRAVNKTVGSWVEIPFDIEDAGRYSISLFQHLRDDNGIWKVTLDGKELYEAGESHISGGYRVSLVRQLPPELVNTTLDFYNLYRKDEHEDYIYGQRRERKIGIFELEPGEHRLRLTCVGANPLSYDKTTGEQGYNLTADVLSARKLPQLDLDAWMEGMLELERQAAEGQ